MDSILIKNGRVLDPASGFDGISDIFIQDGTIKKIGAGLTCPAEDIIDASGLWVTPGFIDLHTHLREPGFEYKETIASGTRSGAAGGFTTLCAMPNTSPVCDSALVTEYVKLKAEKEGVIRVLPIGAITKGQEGVELSEIGRMAKAGICALSEDGKSVISAGLLKTAMNYAKMFGLPIFSHCEDKTLAGAGVMNAGKQAQIMGLKGIPSDSEEIIVARDIMLAANADVHLHICHISTRFSVDLVRMAKFKGIHVTAEATPHHFSLSEDFITDYDTNTKMNPPLRSKSDLAAVLRGLKDGTIDAIATDHAPHAFEEKNCEYDLAPFGIVGLETAFPLGVTNLVETGVLSPISFIAKLTSNPAKILGLDIGSLREGTSADITISDPNADYVIDISKFHSKSKNSPFGGMHVRGRVLHTIFGGKIILRNGEII